MKKLLLTILFGLFTPFALTACGNEGTTSTSNEENGTAEVAEPIEIDFWHAMSGVHEEALTELIELFHAENDHIRVNAVNQGGYSDLGQVIMANARANTLPHLAQSVPTTVTQYIDNNFLLPLNSFIEDSEIGLTDEEFNDIISVFRESSTWGDTLYSIPFGKSTRILFYNRTMLEEHGIEVPTSWEELIAAAEVLTVDNTIGMGFENSFEPEFMALLMQHGGVYVDEEAMTAQFASQEGVDALTIIADLVESGNARLAGEDRHLSGVFGRGGVAMYIGSSAGLPHVAAAMQEGIEWGTAVIPSFNGESATAFAGNDVVMFDSGTEAEQRAAWEFLRFSLQPEVTAQWAIASGFIPVRYSAKELPLFVEYLEANPIHAAASNQFEAGFNPTRVNGASAIRNIVLEELDNIMLGRVSVAEGLQSAQDRANEVLENQN